MGVIYWCYTYDFVLYIEGLYRGYGGLGLN